jgi:hypothetical protein
MGPIILLPRRTTISSKFRILLRILCNIHFHCKRIPSSLGSRSSWQLCSRRCASPCTTIVELMAGGVSGAPPCNGWPTPATQSAASSGTGAPWPPPPSSIGRGDWPHHHQLLTVAAPPTRRQADLEGAPTDLRSCLHEPNIKVFDSVVEDGGAPALLPTRVMEA